MNSVKITNLSRGVRAIPDAGSDSSGNMRVKINELLDRFASQAEKHFLLEWEGDKIPRGAIIDGKTIGLTLNGIVVSTEGDLIGIYQRIVESGGASGKEQRMIIAVK